MQRSTDLSKLFLFIKKLGRFRVRFNKEKRNDFLKFMGILFYAVT